MTKMWRGESEVNSNSTKLWQKSTRVRDLLVRLIWAVINNFIVIKIYNKTSQDKVSTPTCATAAWEGASLYWGLCHWWPLRRPRMRIWCPDPVSRGQWAIISLRGDTWGGPQWSGAALWWPRGGPPAPRWLKSITMMIINDGLRAIKYHGGGHFLNFHALMCI